LLEEKLNTRAMIVRIQRTESHRSCLLDARFDVKDKAESCDSMKNECVKAGRCF